VGGESFVPDLARWDAWHPEEVTHVLADVEEPWYVTAGWALDLFRGEQTREHDDLEISVPEESFASLRRALSGYELWAVGNGLAHTLTPETLAAHHQTWVRDAASGAWRLDVMREPWDGETWVFRRDPRIRLAGEQVIARTASGIPYARPEIALLYKAKAPRPKDEADFASVLPFLGPEQRRWLAESIALGHPGHPWLRALAG
jgi:hypothetical protein